MMTLGELAKAINIILPFQTAMEGDKIGIQIGNKDQLVRKCITTLEITPELIDEAILTKADCIISFHPLIYRPLQTLDFDERVAGLVKNLIINNICVIVAHTNFDANKESASFKIADYLGVIKPEFIHPINGFNENGMGAVGYLEHPHSYNILLEKLEIFSDSPIKYSIGKSKLISKIAVVAGSGMSFFQKVLEMQVDAFITADISYHDFHRANGIIMLADMGHYEMERKNHIWIWELLKKKLNSNIEMIYSKVYTNPVRYFSNDSDYLIRQKDYLLKF